MRENSLLGLAQIISSCFLLSVGATAQSPPAPSELTPEALHDLRAAYPETVANLRTFREKEAAKYSRAKKSARREIIRSVRTHLETTLCERIFPAWYGTPWDFNGISSKPGEGKIACGYFVSSCLVHLDVNVPRIKLAQQASQRIIGTFIARENYKVSVGKKIEDVKISLLKSGDGIYLVGLDRHVGFITVSGEQLSFVHSSYYKPGPVVKSEAITTRNPLRDSNYRVIGKLFSDEMIEKWLQGHRYLVK